MPEKTTEPTTLEKNAKIREDEAQLLLGVVGNEQRLLGAQAEVQRELGVRQRCYPGWVRDGKLAELDATERFNRLSWANEILRNLLDIIPRSSETPF